MRRWPEGHCATIKSKTSVVEMSTTLATLAVCIGDEELILVLRGQGKVFRLIDTWIRARYHNG